MPGFASQLNEGQLARLVAYVERLGGGSAEASIDGAEGDSVLSGGLQDDNAAGFAGHTSDASTGSGNDAVALGSESFGAPAPVGNSVGWTLALAIAAFLIALGSAITGAMPRDAEERAAG